MERNEADTGAPAPAADDAGLLVAWRLWLPAVVAGIVCSAGVFVVWTVMEGAWFGLILGVTLGAAGGLLWQRRAPDPAARTRGTWRPVALYACILAIPSLVLLPNALMGVRECRRLHRMGKEGVQEVTVYAGGARTAVVRVTGPDLGPFLAAFSRAEPHNTAGGDRTITQFELVVSCRDGTFRYPQCWVSSEDPHDVLISYHASMFAVQSYIRLPQLAASVRDKLGE